MVVLVVCAVVAELSPASSRCVTASSALLAALLCGWSGHSDSGALQAIGAPNPALCGQSGSHEDGQHDEGGSDADRHPVGAHGNGCRVCRAIRVTLHLFHLDEVGRVCGVQTQPDGALRTVNDLGMRVCWTAGPTGEASV